MCNVLICNAGSSSIKFSVIEAISEELELEGTIDWSTVPASLTLRLGQRPAIRQEVPQRNHRDAISHVLHELRLGMIVEYGALDKIQAVGYRIVHGGEKYTSAVRITPDVQREIRKLEELAPLHNAASVEVIEVVQQALPNVPQVAAFDTAFHSTISEAARTYPVPFKWTSEWHLRRFGFHGLSHSYCATRAAEMIARQNLKLIVAHLGNGASISAIRNGVCVDTSMGFTPLEGLMMGTRSGSVDPGMLVYLLRHRGLDAERLDQALNHESGLLGVSGVASDMREVLKAAEANESRARLAIDIYVHRIQQTVGAMAATLGGVDALVFTAGVGEHAPVIRQRVCDNLCHLGLEIDRDANATSKPDADIATQTSTGRILAIATREDLSIVRETRNLLYKGEHEGDPHDHVTY